MDRTVASLNIEYLRKRLDETTDEIKRTMILRLLSEEEAKLQAPLRALIQKENVARLPPSTRASGSDAGRSAR
jgi:hypothetical protein